MASYAKELVVYPKVEEEFKRPIPKWRLPVPLKLADFDLGTTLGLGTFARVRFVKHRATGSRWAMKMLKKTNVIRLQQVQHILSERAILTELDHPFIVRLGGAFQDAKYLYLLLEYIPGGELFTHLRRARRFDNNAAQFYAGQVVVIFDYLHKQDLVYRDLKPENLLLNDDGYLKLTDFGFAKRCGFKTYTLCGTPEYMAPEVLLNKGHGKGVDWWTLGILIFEMLVGEPPWVHDDPMGIYEQILSGKLFLPRALNRTAKNLLKHLLTADTTVRFGCMKYGAEDIKKHRWFTGLDFTSLYNRGNNPPLVPKLNSADDTSMYEAYPNSVEEPQFPVFTGRDPFEEFDLVDY